MASGTWRALSAAALAAVLTACSSLPGFEPSQRPTKHLDAAPVDDVSVPARGTAWFGASIDWGEDSLARYSRRLGHRPAIAVAFAGFPMTAQERVWTDQAVDQAREEGSRILLTLEPHDGLAAVTVARARSLARQLAGYNRSGVPVVVRFAHEMNGSWYPWGQQPETYVAAFRRVAAAIHTHAAGTAVMWAPNYGGGYPFAGGAHQADPGSGDAMALDTDGDGSVTEEDDPYAPYWPGRRYVDWVGMSLYHWGATYPWGENEVSEQGKFVDMLRGTYDGTAGDELAVPDFYRTYGSAKRLPVAITETAALYVPGGDGADELEIKQSWWEQVLAPGNAAELPWLRMVNWFEWRKVEPEVGGVVDWTATSRADVRAAFTSALPDWLRYGRPRG
ncbi:hypothetical protein KLP28_02930 [Nocardioidaceae bacterium]|nr:hypothetical protein KLP28_02930 [Nocardioidaceae bacterium]